jgi:HAD superfamily hydrolase (TIGR01509 family)
MPALIFDCDGVLADTERDGHLPAFNETFRHFDLPVCWSVEDYAQKLKIGGGKERLRSLLTPEFIAQAQIPEDPDLQAQAVASWHRYKTNVYTELVEQGVLPARPGIRRVVEQARQARWTLVVASTSHERSVRAVLNHAVGEEVASEFVVFAGDIVPKKKPAPDIYLLAMRKLGLTADQVVVIEDSQNGLEAALAAGLSTLITTSSFTTNDNFAGASLVVSSLGDLSTEAVSVLANPRGLDIGTTISLIDVTRIMNSTTHDVKTAGRR